MWTRVDCHCGSVVRGRRDVDLDARTRRRRSGRAACSSPSRSGRRCARSRSRPVQPAPVALPPDEPLVIRRDELAVVERELAGGRVVEERVVDRARELASTSFTPVTSQTPSSFAAAPSRRSAREPTATEFSAIRAKTSFAPSSSRPAKNFAQPRTGRRRRRSPGRRRARRRCLLLGHEPFELVECPLEIENDRLGLDAGDLHSSLHRPRVRS